MNRFIRGLSRALCLAVVLGSGAIGSGSALQAKEISVAVAANFTEVAKELGTMFKAETGNTVLYSFGATGQLYTQITQGAPFEVFLAADQARPEKAEAEGYAVPGSRFTYAEGKLVLWSTDPTLIKDNADILKDPKVVHVAVANPKTAPYGAAAVAVLQKLGLYDAVKPKIVEGKSISQTQQFAATGSAQAGFVALSQVIKDKSGSSWVVPADLYAPIEQDAVLLKTGAEDPVAKAYIDFIRSDKALKLIESYGYGIKK